MAAIISRGEFAANEGALPVGCLCHRPVIVIMIIIIIILIIIMIMIIIIIIIIMLYLVPYA